MQKYVVWHFLASPTGDSSDGWHFPPACSGLRKGSVKELQSRPDSEGSEGMRRVNDRRTEPNLPLMVHFLLAIIKKGQSLGGVFDLTFNRKHQLVRYKSDFFYLIRRWIDGEVCGPCCFVAFRWTC